MLLYCKYVWMHIRSEMQYRLNFFLGVLGQFSNTFFVFITLYLLFERFGSLLDYTRGEVALCFAVANLSFSITECCARGFDRFSRLIILGDFDRLLLRPRNLAQQVFGSQFELSRIGRMVASIAALVYALTMMQTAWTLLRGFTVALMVLGGIAIYTGIFVLGAAVCFFTMQGLEVVNIFTDGGREIASYPLTIYAKGLTRFFTFAIPFATINYLPLEFVAGHTPNPWYALFPVAGALFLIPCLLIWYGASRRYLSTGN